MKTMNSIRRLLGLALTVGAFSVCIPSLAVAAEESTPNNRDTTLSSTAGAPWVTNITPEKQKKAQELFDEGRKQFTFPDFVLAEKKFREALTYWDHPAIHYNLALSLRATDKPTEAYLHLELALKYNGDALSPERKNDALKFLSEMEKKIAILEISAREPGTTITLDDNVVKTIPSRQLLSPGPHHIVATKPDHDERTYEVSLSAGEKQTLQTHVFRSGLLERNYRPVSFWIPVAVTGAGAAFIATGAIFANRSNTLRKEYDDYVSRDPNGMKMEDTPLNKRDKADTFDTLSTISYVTGAIVLTGGIAGFWFNRTRTEKVTPEQLEKMTAITPVVAPNVLGAVATGRF
jgi:hypothetical protein